jgi:hypothetical protein
LYWIILKEQVLNKKTITEVDKMKNLKLLVLVTAVAIIASGCGIGLKLVVNFEPNPIVIEDLNEDSTATITVSARGIGYITVSSITATWEPEDGEPQEIDLDIDDNLLPLPILATFGIWNPIPPFEFDISDLVGCTTSGTITIDFAVDGGPGVTLEIEVIAPEAEV